MEIALSRGKRAVIDDEDAELVQPYRWHAAHPCGDRWYAETWGAAASGPRKIRMHRLILGVTDKNLFVDHIDGDGLNNRRANLRLATPTENARNRRRDRRNKSGYTGVSWDRRRGLWVAHIRDAGQRRTLGHFASVLDAARTYNDAAEDLYGGFARLNDLPADPAAQGCAVPTVPAGPVLTIEQALAHALANGHLLTARTLLAGIVVRHCTRCLCLLIERDNGPYGGGVLTTACQGAGGGGT